MQTLWSHIASIMFTSELISVIFYVNIELTKVFYSYNWKQIMLTQTLSGHLKKSRHHIVLENYIFINHISRHSHLEHQRGTFFFTTENRWLMYQDPMMVQTSFLGFIAVPGGTQRSIEITNKCEIQECWMAIRTLVYCYFQNDKVRSLTYIAFGFIVSISHAIIELPRSSYIYLYIKDVCAYIM